MQPIIRTFQPVEGAGLSTRLKKDGSGEFGVLSQAFHKMVIGIVQGNHQKKSVGQHNL